MKINDKFEKAKRRLANRLSRATDSYSTKTKKWVLTITGLVCAFLCIWLTLFPFIHKRKSFNAITTMPVVIHPSPNESILSAEEYRLLKSFLRTMDSLKQVDQEAYHKAMMGREGLIDSILFLLEHSGQQWLSK